MHLCALYRSQNKQRLFPYTALSDWFLITEKECVYCAVRTGSLYIIHVNISPQTVKRLYAGGFIRGRQRGLTFIAVLKKRLETSPSAAKLPTWSLASGFKTVMCTYFSSLPYVLHPHTLPPNPSHPPWSDLSGEGHDIQTWRFCKFSTTLPEFLDFGNVKCIKGFYCRSYCLLNMFRAPLCPSSGAQE